jgi:putative DNA-invertase from lambdoid prophage Rac
MTIKRKGSGSSAPVKVARIYMRVSTEAQDLKRQESIVQMARENGYYIAGIYREKASGARADRPELLRMIDDLQPGEIVVAEKIDRISRLPLLVAVAEFERDLLVDRTQAGLARARAEGKKLGRRPALTTAQQADAMARLMAGESVAKVARDYGTTRQSIMRVRARLASVDVVDSM